MPAARKKKPKTKRTIFSMPADLYVALKRALIKRAALAEWSRKPKRATTISGWIREEARKLVQSHP